MLIKCAKAYSSSGSVV